MTIDHLQAPPRDAALSPPRPAPRLPRAYVGLWAGLSALSAVYLTLAAFDGASLQGARLPQRIAASEGEAARQTAQNRKLRDAMAEFQSDIGRLRSDVEQRGSAPEVVGALAAIEERASLETGRPVERREAAAQPLPRIEQQVAPQPPANAQPLNVLETGSIKPLPQAAVKPAAVEGPAAQPAAAPERQATLAAPAAAPPLPQAAAAAAPAQPIAFGAPVVTPAPRPFAIQLGSASDLDQIRSNWTQLAEENKDALRNLQPRVASTGTEAAGTTYDLLAGPVKSAVDARKICKTLAARGIDCKVSPFTGDAL